MIISRSINVAVGTLLNLKTPCVFLLRLACYFFEQTGKDSFWFHLLVKEKKEENVICYNLLGANTFGKQKYCVTSGL